MGGREKHGKRAGGRKTLGTGAPAGVCHHVRYPRRRTDAEQAGAVITECVGVASDGLYMESMCFLSCNCGYSHKCYIWVTVNDISFRFFGILRHVRAYFSVFW